MTDLDWMGPEPDDRNLPPKKCRRHQWGWVWDTNEFQACVRCSKRKNEAAARRGKNNRSRGLSIQRQVAEELGMEHIPGNGPADARDDTFYAEIKSGPSWYSVRVEAELDNLPSTRRPMFVAASTPGPGKRRRVYVTVSLGDLVSMVGPHAQVSMWAPEWVALRKETAA